MNDLHSHVFVKAHNFSTTMSTSHVQASTKDIHHEEKVTVTFHSNPDLILEVFSIDKKVLTPGSRPENVRTTATFHVEKSRLAELPTNNQTKRTPIQAMLKWQNASQDKILLDDPHDHARGWALMLHIFNDKDIPIGFLADPPATLWHLAVVCDKWNIDHKDERVRKFFAMWYPEYQAFKSGDMRERIQAAETLLWPAWYFDHAEAFSKATNFLIYNGTHHIQAHNPTKYSNIIMPGRINRKPCPRSAILNQY